jgi:antimicrobial peptide system SdpA family protein
VTRLVLALCWAAAFVLVLRSLTDSPIRLSHKRLGQVIALSPQGWAFFTRNPREVLPQIYRQEQGRWIRAIRTNAEPTYLFGLNRIQRAHYAEMEALATQVPKGAWRATRTRFSEVASLPDAPMVRVVNRVQKPFLCGRYVIQKRNGVPWAWSGSWHKVSMPTQTAKVEVRCPATRG